MVGKTKIDKLIIQEKKYFLPIFKRQEAASTKIKKKWRKETLHKEKRGYLEKFIKFIIIQFNLGIFKGMKISNKVWWGKIRSCLNDFRYL